MNPLRKDGYAIKLDEEGSAEQADNWDFVSKSFDIRAGDPNTLWQLIMAIHFRDQSEEVQSVLSAGPLEELLGNHGPAFIEVVEQQAKDDPAFARLLRGLYRFRMSDDVWGRVTAISNRL